MWEVQEIFRIVIQQFDGIQQENTNLLCKLLALLLHVAVKYKNVCTSEMAEERIQAIMEDVYTLLSNEWIVKYCSPTFGNPWKLEFLSAKEDIEVRICMPLHA